MTRLRVVIRALRLLACALGMAAERADPSLRPTTCGNAPPSEPPRTVGLLLSGGAARGLAHVGMRQVHEEIGVPIEVSSATKRFSAAASRVA